MPPFSRRGFFMTASAAAAAGYTLAAGPVRADAIKTDTNGLTRRRRQGQGRRRRDAGLFRKAGQCAEPAGHPGCHGDFRDARIHPRRHPPPCACSAPSRSRPITISAPEPTSRRSSTSRAASDRQRQDRHGAVCRSRRYRGLGEVARRRHQPARHHGLLPRRPHRMALLDPQCRT